MPTHGHAHHRAGTDGFRSIGSSDATLQYLQLHPALRSGLLRFGCIGAPGSQVSRLPLRRHQQFLLNNAVQCIRNDILSIMVCFTVLQAAPNDGKYNPKKYGKSGKYVHSGEGDYVEDVSRYRYIHYDDGNRGRYFHIHIPYDGGYGNYEGGHEPYRYPPYDPTGEYAYVLARLISFCKFPLDKIFLFIYTISSEIINKYSSDPYRANAYDIKKPSIYLEYGVPTVSESNTASSVVDVRQSLLRGPGTAYLPAKEPELDVRKSLLPGPGTAYLPVLTPEEQRLASEKKAKILPHPNSLQGKEDASSKTGSGEGATASVSTDDSRATTTDSLPTDAGESALHNQPCFAVSGTLKLSKT
ncbi:hypothetical protein ZHAS_00012032 [Anopheles sinensis]|uniref:Uncharacterized protein n=1 Tax=Anopheles sinensis TaxID=74873 RepID=A0A084W211_ANOSI|nr:hypothetical protein ZHAS_00012032 [Anopheles sinensis]